MLLLFLVVRPGLVTLFRQSVNVIIVLGFLAWLGYNIPEFC